MTTNVNTSALFALIGQQQVKIEMLSARLQEMQEAKKVVSEAEKPAKK